MRPDPVKNGFIWFAALFVIALVCYAPSLSGGFAWDEGKILRNPLLRSADGLIKLWGSPRLNSHESNYWPFTYTILWLEFQLWGSATLGYHVVNILLHAGCAWLLGAITSSCGFKHGRFASLLFLLHPVQVESVAWIIEIKNVLAGFLALTSTLTFLYWSKSNKPLFISISLICFLLGLLSKSAILPLPLCIAVLILYLNRFLSRREIIALAFVCVIAAVFAILDMRFARTNVAALIPSVPLASRLSLAGPALFLYLGKLLLPMHLSPMYAPIHVSLLLALTLLLCFIAAVGVLIWNRKYGVAAALTIFALMLLPVLGFVPFAYIINYSIADRFLYLAGAPIFVAIAEGTSMLFSRSGSAARMQLMLRTLIIAVLALVTIKQAYIWGDDRRLWNHIVHSNPESVVAHLNLGATLLRERDLQGALVEFDECLCLDPNHASSYVNKATVLSQLGNDAEAERLYKEALRCDPKDTDALDNLGMLLVRNHRYFEASLTFNAALQLDPTDSMAQSYLQQLQHVRN